MNAVHGAGFDRFLNPFTAVAILANSPGSSEIGLDCEGVGGHVGAVATADTNSLIDPDSPLSQVSAKNWFEARDLGVLKR